MDKGTVGRSWYWVVVTTPISVLHIIPVFLQEGLEAGMGAGVMRRDATR